jgi:carbonic anhydrase/acetyltransferase-like protein (isoleucine patch superfamily)
MGHPASVRRSLTEEDVASIVEYAANYVHYAAQYHQE